MATNNSALFRRSKTYCMMTKAAWGCFSRTCLSGSIMVTYCWDECSHQYWPAYSAYHHTMGKLLRFLLVHSVWFASVEKRGSIDFLMVWMRVLRMEFWSFRHIPLSWFQDGMTSQFVADLDSELNSKGDITALINYVNNGGNILFMDAIQTTNPEPIGRLAECRGCISWWWKRYADKPSFLR